MYIQFLHYKKTRYILNSNVFARWPFKGGRKSQRCNSPYESRKGILNVARLTSSNSMLQMRRSSERETVRPSRTCRLKNHAFSVQTEYTSHVPRFPVLQRPPKSQTGLLRWISRNILHQSGSISLIQGKFENFDEHDINDSTMDIYKSNVQSIHSRQVQFFINERENVVG